MPATRRGFLQALGGSAAALAQKTKEPKRPNILVILCDDLGLGDCSPYNPESKIPTPRMAAFSRQGMRFLDAHSPSAVCTPTRYGLLTGRYCWRTTLKSGVLRGASPILLEPGRTTLAAHLQAAGYRTGGFGKWHLGLGNRPVTDYSQPLTPGPNDFGFDEYFGIPASLDMPPYVFFRNGQTVEQPTGQIGNNGESKRGPFWTGGAIAPSFRMEEVLPAIVREASQFLRQQKGDRPFFAYVPLTGPHTPWVPSSEFQGPHAAGLYGQFVTEVDSSIGKILEALEATGQAQNTLVVLTSDNGAPWEKQDADRAAGHWANTQNWRGQKSDIQEAGHRVPFLVRWPGKVKPGSTSKQLVCLTDLFATLAAAAQVPLGPTMAEDSFSFLPALLHQRGEGKSGPAMREHVVLQSGSGLYALREGDWKFVDGRGSGGFTQPAKVTPGPGEPTGELYHLTEDPREGRNLFAERPEVVARMRQRLQAIQQGQRTRPA